MKIETLPNGEKRVVVRLNRWNGVSVISFKAILNSNAYALQEAFEAIEENEAIENYYD